MILIYFLEKFLWLQSREGIQGDRTEYRKEPWREITKAELRNMATRKKM